MRKNTSGREKHSWGEKIGNWLRKEGYYFISVRNRDLAINCLEKEGIDIILVEEKALQENSFPFFLLFANLFPM